MADEWGVPEVNDWWLPDENACPPVVRTVQAFMEDRLPQAGGQSRSEDQRNIKGIFSKLSLHENPKLKEESDIFRGIATLTVINQARTLRKASLPEVDIQDQYYESFVTKEDGEMQQEIYE